MANTVIIKEAAERLTNLNPKGDHSALDTHRIFKDAVMVSEAYLELLSRTGIDILKAKEQSAVFLD